MKKTTKEIIKGIDSSLDAVLSVHPLTEEQRKIQKGETFEAYMKRIQELRKKQK